MHIFFECPWVVQFWNLSSCDFGDQAFPSSLDWVWKQLGKDKAELFVVLCWQVWKARNELVFENSQAPPRLYISRVSDWLHEYQQAQVRNHSASPNSEESKSWCCPPQEILKINCGGAFDVARDKFGVGFVVRNWKGDFVVAGAKTLWVGSSAEEIEAQAVLWALCCIKGRGWDQIIVEGDCKYLFDALNGHGQRSFYIRSIIDNCMLYKDCFRSLSFVFCPRACNSVAHRLAQGAAHGVSLDIWEVVAPIFVRDALYSDLINCNA